MFSNRSREDLYAKIQKNSLILIIVLLTVSLTACKTAKRPKTKNPQKVEKTQRSPLFPNPSAKEGKEPKLRFSHRQREDRRNEI